MGRDAGLACEPEERDLTASRSPGAWGGTRFVTDRAIMLRITVRRRRRCTVLEVEGRVVDDWARLLDSECRALLRPGRTVVLDLSGVAFVDNSGAAMLRALDAGGVRRVNVPEQVESFVRWQGAP
jgi:hypothetical protein